MPIRPKLTKFTPPIKILAWGLFVSGVALYLFFATAHPLLHNHPIDGQHHPHCPACNFSAIAGFSTVPEAVIVPSVPQQLAQQIFFVYQEPDQQTFPLNFSIRAPPSTLL